MKTILTTALLLPTLALAQPSWQSTESTIEEPVELFRATMTPNFPTTTMLYKGDWHYEISHRFHPTIDEGYDANFGFDGPASMRTAVGYGASDNLSLTLGRSNLLDNLDLQIKYRLWDMDHSTLPSAVAMRFGLAWNTDIPTIIDRGKTDGANFQYYAQLVYNTLLFDGKLGVGIVPSYLYNSAIFSVDKQYTFTLGNYYQYYFNDLWGLWLEYNPALSGYQGILLPGESGHSYDSLSFGTSIETGGHAFYIFATNNTRLNPAQFLVGAPTSASPKNWHLAFGITRHL
ncbi:MAG: hypothetical protein ACI906_001015 [Candidatus Latescibacterota bacterium]|jgi:hypothetical protein